MKNFRMMIKFNISLDVKLYINTLNFVSSLRVKLFIQITNVPITIFNKFLNIRYRSHMLH